jgi:hypothetical protein
MQPSGSSSLGAPPDRGPLPELFRLRPSLCVCLRASQVCQGSSLPPSRPVPLFADSSRPLPPTSPNFWVPAPPTPPPRLGPHPPRAHPSARRAAPVVAVLWSVVFWPEGEFVSAAAQGLRLSSSVQTSWWERRRTAARRNAKQHFTEAPCHPQRCARNVDPHPNTPCAAHKRARACARQRRASLFEPCSGRRLQSGEGFVMVGPPSRPVHRSRSADQGSLEMRMMGTDAARHARALSTSD